MILAILKAQLLSMRMRSGARRGGAAFSSLTGLIFYGFWAFLGWGVMLYFSSPDETPFFLPVLSSGLMFAMLYWQLAPVISASFGASLDLRKLLAYPIPHRKLFLVEVLLRVTTCGEMLILVGGAAIGLLRNPLFGWRSALYIVPGAILFAAMNILLSAGTRSLLERIFLRSKLKEVIVFLMVLVALVPRLLAMQHVGKTALLRFAPSQVVWPWAAAARLMLHDSPALGALSAVLWLGLTTLFSRLQFERSIRYDSTTSTKRPERELRPDGPMDRLFRLPARFLSDPLAALVEKELRTFARIPRFRMVYAMSCFFGIALYLPSLNKHREGFFHQNALPIMALYGLLMLGQISYWNSFGFDRSAAQGYFSWPVRFRDVLMAKNLSVVFMLIPQILIISIIGALVHLPAGPGKILETILVMTIASLYWFAMGNICSVRMPRSLDPDKMNQMSNKLQALTMTSAPFLLIPLALAYWSRWFFESELAFAAIMAVAALVGGIFYWVGLDSAATTGSARREAMLTSLSRTDGPLSVT